MADCFVGIDLGTSGCRAIAIDRTGREIAGARIGLPASRHPTPEASEQDADAWWRAVEAVLPDLMAQRPGRVRAIAVEVLTDMDPEDRTSERLRTKLELV